MTELDIIEAAIRRGFEIAKDEAYIVCYDDCQVEWENAGRALETAIENMRASVSVP